MASERPDIDRLADTVRTMLRRINGRDGLWHDSIAALDELVALAREERRWYENFHTEMQRADAAEARADELQRERDFLLSDPDMVSIKEWVEGIREQARREADQLRAVMQDVENTLRIHARGVELIGARHKLVAALAGVQADNKDSA